jgi:hypothetical protein
MPPLVPEIIREDMAHALEHIETNIDLEESEIEQMLINFGKALWPYRKAFQELYDVYDSQLGEKMFISKIDSKLKRRYRIFVEQGGSFVDLHTGKNIAFFSEEERVTLCEIFVSIKREVSSHTAQKIISTDRDKYEKRVIEFQNILDDTEKRLDTVRQMIHDEQEHPRFVSEMRELIYHFEEGLCLLSAEPDFGILCHVEEHYDGRRYELSKFPK